jgi:hypothetical protein
MTQAALLVLADGRFPAGGHAHSGGAEEAVKAGRITGAESLEGWGRRRWPRPPRRGPIRRSWTPPPTRGHRPPRCVPPRGSWGGS